MEGYSPGKPLDQVGLLYCGDVYLQCANPGGGSGGRGVEEGEEEEGGGRRRKEEEEE